MLAPVLVTISSSAMLDNNIAKAVRIEEAPGERFVKVVVRLGRILDAGAGLVDEDIAGRSQTRRAAKDDVNGAGVDDALNRFETARPQ